MYIKYVQIFQSLVNCEYFRANVILWVKPRERI